MNYIVKMGSFLSKHHNNHNNTLIVESQIPSTNVATPKCKMLLDPRSPTEAILRTPIEINLRNSTNHAAIATTPVIKSSSVNPDDQTTLDPRSPSVDFLRTPITLPNGALKLRNKKIDELKQLTNFSPMKPHGTLANPTRKQGPVLLEVNSVIKQVTQEKRKSFVGLLETNLDFVETHLDSVIETKKSLNDELILAESNEQIKENAASVTTIIEEIVEISKETTQIISQELIEDENSEKQFSGNQDNITEEINQIVEEIEQIAEEEAKIVQETVAEETENIANTTPINKDTLEFKEDIISPIKETLEKFNQIDTEIKEVLALAVNPKPVEVIDDEALANAFDKKITNLIYEDEQTVDFSKKKRQVPNGNRTPLSDKNIMQNKSKSANKLRVHDKPSKKQNYVVSKIPVFKEKKGKPFEQCENTPPRQAIAQKSRKIQWDADKTMVI